MTYDLHGGWDDVMDHHAGFTSDGRHPNDPNNQLTIKYSVEKWVDMGCDPNKMTLGLAAYGRAFKSTNGKGKRLEKGTTRGLQVRV